MKSSVCPFMRANNGNGRALDRIKALCNEDAVEHRTYNPSIAITAKLAWRCAFASKLQFVLG